jgi:hypothetical protein
MPISEKVIRGTLYALPTLIIVTVILVLSLMAAGGSVHGSSAHPTVTASPQDSSVSVNCKSGGASGPHISFDLHGHPVSVCAPAHAATTPAAG